MGGMKTSVHGDGNVARAEGVRAHHRSSDNQPGNFKVNVSDLLWRPVQSVDATVISVLTAI